MNGKEPTSNHTTGLYTYTPDASLLHGLSIEKASLYGMPHMGARYTKNGIKWKSNGARNYEPLIEWCAVCGKAGRPNCHHVVPLSVGQVFELHGHVMRSPLFAVCGSGTTGCHNGFHGGNRFKPVWAWDEPDFAEQWWSGELLKKLQPNSTLLYDFGQWEIHDKLTGRVIRYRERI